MRSERETPKACTNGSEDAKPVWGSRFKEPLDPRVKEFLASIDFDQELAWADIAGSIAHAKMLGRTEVISIADSEALVEGLRKVWTHFDQGQASLSTDMEDIHMNVEALLRAEIGQVASTLHAGRSRNDQVATDLRLFTREQIFEVLGRIGLLQRSLLALSTGPEGISPIILQGHTHLQPAQPVPLTLVILAYFFKLQRDMERLEQTSKRVNVSPLGAGALAGTSIPIDPGLTAALLGFESVFDNSLDAVSDRDFVFEVLSNLTLMMVHLSSFCEEVILWCSSEFGWARLGDQVSTGSSMMPQKRNPDVLELVRGKTGRVLGSLVSMATTLKALPLAYNKDLQEDKEPLFDAFGTVISCLEALNTVVHHLEPCPNKVCISAGTFATDIAEYLVLKGTPFREAHGIVGKIMLYCDENELALDGLDLDILGRFSAQFDEDSLSLLSPKGSVEAKSSPGGAAPEQVTISLERARSMIDDNMSRLEELHAPILKARSLLYGKD